MSQEHPDRRFRDDLEWCYDAVRDVSRTFALTIEELDEPMSREVCVGYLLCRIADTVEDAGHIPPGDQRAILECYDRVLDADDGTTAEAFGAAVGRWIPDEPNDDWAVVERAPRVVETFEGLDGATRRAIRPPVRELVGGMAMFVGRYADQGGLRLEDFEELEEYCWYAAGTVGRLVTGLLSREAEPGVRETLRENAWSFALLLQLVNVAKDVAVDYREENNVYLPQELLRAQQLAVEDIDDPARGDAFEPVIRRVVERAEGHLDGAQAWLDAMPEVRGNTRSAWAIPFLLAVATIRELDARPGDVIRTGGVKVARTEVQALLDRFAGNREPDVADLRAKIRRRPLDEY